MSKLRQGAPAGTTKLLKAQQGDHAVPMQVTRTSNFRLLTFGKPQSTASLFLSENIQFLHQSTVDVCQSIRDDQGARTFFFFFGK